MAKALKHNGKQEDIHVYLKADTARRLRVLAVNECRSISAQAAYLIERGLEAEKAA